MLTYAEDCKHKDKYRKLKPSGVAVLVSLKHTDDVIVLEGVSSGTIISRLQKMLERKTNIHVAQQRLFAGGEEMSSDKSLIEYFSTEIFVGDTPRCLIELRSHATLLISTLECPGPMLTEIEVRPGNVEHVIDIKRRIRDKLRVGIKNQHLYLHPNEMTTFPRRQALSNDRLLSSYLSPLTPEMGFLELVVLNTESNTNRGIFVRIPRQMICLKNKKTNILKYSNQLKTNFKMPRDELPKSAQAILSWVPPPPPQTPETTLQNPNSASSTPEITQNEGAFENDNYEIWWHTCRLSLAGIMKRDPKVSDILKLLVSKIKNQPSTLSNFVSAEESLSFIKKADLKYFDFKYMCFGKHLQPDSTISEDNLMRMNEMLLYLNLPNLNFNSTLKYVSAPTVQSAEHLPPLELSEDTNVRYTMPPEPTLLQWKIDSENPLDEGANPTISFETSAFSYAYRYGSWDIPEHRKIFVEIMLEGSFVVGDLGLNNLLTNDLNEVVDQIDYDVNKLIYNKNTRPENDSVQRMIYYVQDQMEINILGPGNIKGLSISKDTPFQSPAIIKWEADQRQTYSKHAKLRLGEIGSKTIPRPPPLRIKASEKNVIKESVVSPNKILPSWKDRRNLSEVKSGVWSVSREKVSDVQVQRSQAFSTTCKRSSTLDGRPNVSVIYKSSRELGNDIFIPNSSATETCRTAFDFRIQTQFVVSTPADLESQNKIPDSVEFYIKASHILTKITHERHHPNVKTQHTSPQAEMVTMCKVKLPTLEWLESKGLAEESTLDLNR